jgi:hypothetical protein
LNLLELKQQAGIQDNPDQEGLDLFAELIVRECIDIADEYDGVGSTIVSRIREHFGVK